MTPAARARIPTVNETHGGFLDESAPGAWLVLYTGGGAEMRHVANVFGNRRACEDYIHAKCEEHPGRSPQAYDIEVWAISDRWPNDEGESP